jgi:hypothetical protein
LKKIGNPDYNYEINDVLKTLKDLNDEDRVIKTLVKAYTSKAFYSQLNRCIVGGREEKV